jgi:hypothetical protein
MNPQSSLERVFPLSQGSSERLLIRPPRLASIPKYNGAPVLGHAAFLRAWAARRAERNLVASATEPS